MKRTLVLLLAVAGIALVGCASPPPKQPPQATGQKTPTPTSAKPQVMKFGEDRPGKNGVLNVSAPVPYDLPADPARSKDLTRGLRFDVKVSNTSQQALQAGKFTFSATVDSAPAVLVTDEAKQIGTKLLADVLPGKEGKVSIVVAAPAKPSEITVKVTFEKSDLYWTGTV